MAAGAGAPDGGPEGPNRGGAFACNLCLEPARDAVIGRCGHLYCWPCLHQWLLRRPRCAVCGAGISRDTVVPLYGRDSARRDPRLETPPDPGDSAQSPRPRGTPPPLNSPVCVAPVMQPPNMSLSPPEVPPAGPGSSFHVAFGFGAFPFAFFSTIPQPPPTGTGDAGDPPVGSLDSIFLFIAAAFFLWLLSV